MNSKDKAGCNRYDLAEDRLKSFTRSAVRTKVMLCLLKGDLSAGDLVKELETRASTILHTIKDMTEENLVAKTPRGYALTNVGRIQAIILEELVNTIIVLDQHEDFWLTHDLSSIPVELQKRIGMLTESEIITSNSAAVLKSHEHFLKELEQAKEIYGVSPIIAPGHGEMTRKAIKNGIPVELILTDRILEIASKENQDLGSDLLRYDNFKLYHLKEDVRVAFTVTDTILSLGLYRLDGTYDLTGDLICVGEDAKNWGRELFQYYRNKAEMIKRT